VGLTSDVPGFLVLLSLRMGWPLESVCLGATDSHVNHNRTTQVHSLLRRDYFSRSPYLLLLLSPQCFVSSQAMLRPAMLARLRSTLSNDIDVHAAATGLAARQAANMGTAYAERLQAFHSPAFKKACAAKRKAAAAARRAGGKTPVAGC